jgi:hypothetical protein
MQWGNLLATRTRRLSIFQHNPFSPSSPAKNWWIPPAMFASLAFLFFFSYVPFFQNTFLTRVSLFSLPRFIVLIIRVSRSNTSLSPLLSPLGSYYLMRAGSTSSGDTPRASWLGSLGNQGAAGHLHSPCQFHSSFSIDIHYDNDCPMYSS